MNFLKKIDSAIMNKGRKIETGIKKFIDDAPKRRAAKIKRLKDDIEVAKLNAQLRSYTRPKKDKGWI